MDSQVKPQPRRRTWGLVRRRAPFCVRYKEFNLTNLKASLTAIAVLLVSTTAGATGLPATDFSKWASRTLQDAGITDARVVETKYPFSFTFCRKDSPSLWRYDVMSIEQLNALQQGKTVKPLTDAERVIEVDPDSEPCKAVVGG